MFVLWSVNLLQIWYKNLFLPRERDSIGGSGNNFAAHHSCLIFWKMIAESVTFSFPAWRVSLFWERFRVCNSRMEMIDNWPAYRIHLQQLQFIRKVHIFNFSITYVRWNAIKRSMCASYRFGPRCDDDVILSIIAGQVVTENRILLSIFFFCVFFFVRVLLPYCIHSYTRIT